MRLRVRLTEVVGVVGCNEGEIQILGDLDKPFVAELLFWKAMILELDKVVALAKDL